jgi:hypothetical protein
MANTIGGYLQQVFKKRQAPTQQRCQHPVLMIQLFQVRIPGKGHEHITANQQTDGNEHWIHDE